MPKLERGDEIFSGVPETFTSPFPSESAQASAKFQALAQDAPSYLCRLQAKAWQDTTHLTMREVATSTLTGGLRQKLIQDLVYYEPAGVGGTEVLRGLFASASFPDSVSPAPLFAAAVEIGLQQAIDFALSAVPVVGQVLGAAVAVGKFMAQLVRASQEERDRYVPWVDYKRDTDEDLVNVFLVGQIATGVDWTPVWEPPFSVNGGKFTIEETTQPGENRSYAVWGTGDRPEPRYRAGALGAMPGTQRIADRIQIARLYGKIGQEQRDAVTHVGAYYPASAQWATQAWGMVQANGSPDAFKLQPAKLDELWHTYFANWFADGFAQLDYHNDKAKGGNDHWYSALCMAKALCSMVVTEQGSIGLDQDFIANAGNLEAFVGRDLLDNPQNRVKPGQVLRCPYPSIIRPALRAQKLRQLRMLARTPVCALVRPRELPGLPAFAAFQDDGPPEDPNFKTWGEELTAFCDYARGELLKHPIRYAVRTADVQAVDPKFAEAFAASKGMVPELGLRANGEPLAEVPDPPDAESPKGGAPFELAAPEPRTDAKRIAAWAIGGTAAAAALGVGGYLAWKHLT